MSEPYWSGDGVQLWLGDCLDILPTLADASVDAVICDPPYELTGSGRGGFMGQSWDSTGIAFNVEVWRQCWRILKPGGHLAAFGGTRTYHRMTVAIEDAGFEIRDSLHWIYGSGFPKSLDVSKAIDKAAVAAPLWDGIRAHLCYWRDQRGMTNAQFNKAVGGATNGGGRASAWLSGDQRKPELPSKAQWSRLREVLRWDPTPLDDVYDQVKDGAGRPVMEERTAVRPGGSWADQAGAGMFRRGEVTFAVTAPATPDAASWQGWGTALKPSHEPIVLARKPPDGTVAGNVLLHGTGAINIDACRTEAGQDYREKCASVVGLASNRNGDTLGEWTGVREDSAHVAGRWPANVLLSHPPLLDQDGEIIGDACADGCVTGCPVAEMDAQTVGKRASKPSKTGSAGGPGGAVYGGGKGLPRDYIPVSRDDEGGASRFFPAFRYEAKAPASERPRLADGTAHTTVKPLALMRWLVRLLTPPGGLILDPFAGSGTTLEAAISEGANVVGIEKQPEYADLCAHRMAKAIQPALFGDIA